MAFEETQKGNPNQITKKQHCFPASCIRRFCGSDGDVQVMLLPHRKERSAKPDAKVFCAARAWDERAEHGFMIKIEDEYRKLAENVLSNTSINLDAKQQIVVTEMFALWNVRTHWKKQPADDQMIDDAISVSVDLTKDEQEKLEKNGITAVRPDLTIPGRSFTGIGIQLNVMKVKKSHERCSMGDPEKYLG